MFIYDGISYAETIEELGEEKYSALVSEIINAVENFNTEKMNIESYYTTKTVVREVILDVSALNPQYFYFDSVYSGIGYSSNFYNETGIEYAIALRPAYVDDAENKAIFVEQVADEIISGIDDSMSDIEKALYIHDYLVENYKYDERVYEDPYSTVYDIYGFFEQGVGAAQAYTQAYQYIMQYKLGIITTTATSYSMGHIWNVIKINGNWYHVDVTWDDLNSDTAKHNFFLVSDNKISYNDDGSKSHYEWEYPRIYGDIQCSDTTYDSYCWDKKSLKNIQRGNKIPNEIYRVINGEMKKVVAVYRVVNGKLIKFWEE